MVGRTDKQTASNQISLVLYFQCKEGRIIKLCYCNMTPRRITETPRKDAFLRYSTECTSKYVPTATNTYTNINELLGGGVFSIPSAMKFYREGQWPHGNYSIVHVYCWIEIDVTNMRGGNGSREIGTSFVNVRRYKSRPGRHCPFLNGPSRHDEGRRKLHICSGPTQWNERDKEEAQKATWERRLPVKVCASQHWARFGTTLWKGSRRFRHGCERFTFTCSGRSWRQRFRDKRKRMLWVPCRELHRRCWAVYEHESVRGSHFGEGTTTGVPGAECAEVPGWTRTTEYGQQPRIERRSFVL
jgi:hypothetical protein